MTVTRRLPLSGFVCLVIVVLTHIAEMLNVFPGMGWGLPDSPGHYLDLVSAVLGCILLIVGIIVGFSRQQRSKLPGMVRRILSLGGAAMERHRLLAALLVAFGLPCRGPLQSGRSDKSFEYNEVQEVAHSMNLTLRAFEADSTTGIDAARRSALLRRESRLAPPTRRFICG
jgi:hypothetical protein